QGLEVTSGGEQSVPGQDLAHQLRETFQNGGGTASGPDAHQQKLRVILHAIEALRDRQRQRALEGTQNSGAGSLSLIGSNHEGLLLPEVDPGHAHELSATGSASGNELGTAPPTVEILPISGTSGNGAGTSGLGDVGSSGAGASASEGGGSGGNGASASGGGGSGGNGASASGGGGSGGNGASASEGGGSGGNGASASGGGGSGGNGASASGGGGSGGNGASASGGGGSEATGGTEKVDVEPADINSGNKIIGNTVELGPLAPIDPYDPDAAGLGVDLRSIAGDSASLDAIFAEAGINSIHGTGLGGVAAEPVAEQGSGSALEPTAEPKDPQEQTKTFVSANLQEVGPVEAPIPTMEAAGSNPAQRETRPRIGGPATCDKDGRGFFAGDGECYFCSCEPNDMNCQVKQIACLWDVEAPTLLSNECVATYIPGKCCPEVRCFGDVLLEEKKEVAAMANAAEP
ncbi:unnamed protein product, partial [Cyprideis torosa]